MLSGGRRGGAKPVSNVAEMPAATTTTAALCDDACNDIDELTHREREIDRTRVHCILL